MPIRLIALDLDGTLLDSRGEIVAANARAIETARAEGVRIVLVTGRRFRDARPLALELGLDVPVVSHNGALTKHARTLETVAAKLLPLAAAQTLVQIGTAEGLDPMVSVDHEGMGLLLYDRISPGNRALASYIAWSRRIVGDAADAHEAVRRVPSLVEYLDRPPVHISFSGTCRAMEQFGELIERELGPQVQVMNTIYAHQNFTLLDVINPGASKGAGLAAVAAELGVARQEVMAIGDNYNDLEMLAFAAVGVLMGNAAAALRERYHQFHLTATNDEAGVAIAIERFVLNNSD
ncbi:MAG: Cof-type HAD-IIB family hydrolase [Pyrinomonadaceae bacterium]